MRFSSRWVIEDVPGIGNIAGERCSSQASEIWAWRRAVALGNSGKRGVWTRKPARSKRVPRNKGDTSFGANVDQPVGGSIPEIVAILDGHDRGHGARSPELPLEGASGPVELSALNWPVSASSINVHAFGSVQRVQPARSALHECCTSPASRRRWRRRPRVLRRALMRGELITKLVKITVFNRPAEYVVQIDLLTRQYRSSDRLHDKTRRRGAVPALSSICSSSRSASKWMSSIRTQMRAASPFGRFAHTPPSCSKTGRK